MSGVAWRIVQSKWSARAFDGEGARRYGGRWNTPGTPLVYTSESRALAILEILVHLHVGSPIPLFHLFKVEFELDWVLSLSADELPSDWASGVVGRAAQEVGNRWAKAAASPVFRVPSALVPEEFNYLLNPLHPDFARLQIEPAAPFALDPRLGAAAPAH